MRLRKAARVILVGAPGVGKGTQSERLLQRFPQLQSVSTGDLLRNNVKLRTPLGIKVEKTMKSGGLNGWLVNRGRPQVMTLASSAATVDAFYEEQLDDFVTASGALESHSPPEASEDPSASFILDGFPRTAPQAATCDKLIPINLVVSLKTPFHLIMERISGRWVHEPSGRVYNTTFNAPMVPGKDDVTGEPLTQRPDDTEAVYKERFRKFQETSEPLLEHYAKKGVLWEVEGMSSDDISPLLFDEFERRFVH
uniref:GTP:AMP phosphotransferase, mitochondrial n=1 Tax=Colletotrichum fructicola (strain Nara gc5) TaxID=1213859 RepID=L2G9N8_COLFN